MGANRKSEKFESGDSIFEEPVSEEPNGIRWIRALRIHVWGWWYEGGWRASVRWIQIREAISEEPISEEPGSEKILSAEDEKKVVEEFGSEEWMSEEEVK